MLFNLIIKNRNLIQWVIHSQCLNGDIALVIGGLNNGAESFEVHARLNAIDQ